MKKITLTLTIPEAATAADTDLDTTLVMPGYTLRIERSAGGDCPPLAKTRTRSLQATVARRTRPTCPTSPTDGLLDLTLPELLERLRSANCSSIAEATAEAAKLMGRDALCALTGCDPKQLGRALNGGRQCRMHTKLFGPVLASPDEKGENQK